MAEAPKCGFLGRQSKAREINGLECGVRCSSCIRVSNYPLQLTDHTKTMRLPSTPLPAVRHSALSDRERDSSTPRDAVAIACTALLLAIVESFCECFAETHASQATRLLRRATRTAAAAWYLTTSLPCKLLAKAACTLRAASACLRMTAPATHRELAGTNKIIPILASYLVKRRRCRSMTDDAARNEAWDCLLYTSPSPRDGLLSRMPSSA